jgi:hypothetical protein
VTLSRADIPEKALATAEQKTAAAIVLIFAHFTVDVFQQDPDGSDEGNNQRTEG